MATINEVAKMAGVSRMTVSRVINNSGYVKEETREAVEKAIEALNYRPNLLAKGLITHQTRTIAHVMVNTANLFHPRVIQGVEDACYARQYNVVICDANSQQREKDYIDNLSAKFVDGFIFHHLNINAKQLHQLHEDNIRCVVIDNEQLLSGCTNIVTDNFQGSFLAGKHLVELGHQKIAVIHGQLSFDPAKAEQGYEETFQFAIWNNRLDGFRKALTEVGLSLRPDYLVEGSGATANSIHGGYEAMQKILKLEDRPTAIYAQNDHMAIGAMNAIIDAGFKIPADFSVIGYDGLQIDENLCPRLTTIQQPQYEMGKLAAEMLLDLIEGRAEHQNVCLTPQLVVRESTARLDNTGP